MLTSRLFQVYRRFSTTFNRTFVLSPAVKEALEHQRPVVALESTIISHGMPYPQNLECARSLEKIIKDSQVTPATIAIIDSKIHIGLTQSQLQRLAEQGSNGKVKKVSRRDLAFCLNSGELGATTVSGTMICAQMAGIELFVTGGIGGVHRGVEDTWDISADLTELGRTPIAVISAGVKSILDIPKTLEYLETEGVPVVTLGSSEFPSFYSARSGIQSPLQLDTEKQVAQLIYRSLNLRLQNGILIAVPTPASADSKQIEQAIQQSIEEMNSHGIKGPKVTPFLLKRLVDKTDGRSLSANLALVQNNAKIGAKIALQLAKLKTEAQKQHKVISQHRQRPKSIYTIEESVQLGAEPHLSIQRPKHATNRPVVIGGSAIDTYINPLPGKEFAMRRSNAGKVRNSYGGVGRNISQVAGRLGTHPYFITTLGQDKEGQNIATYMHKTGVQIHPIVTNEQATGRYMHVMQKNGDLALGVADMAVNDYLMFESIHQAFFTNHTLLPGTIVLMDSNIPTQQQKRLIPFLNEQKAIIHYEGISTKCTRILQSGCLDQISILKINQIQLGFYISRLKQLLKAPNPESDYDFYMRQLFNMIGKNNKYFKQMKPLRHLIVTQGGDGSDLHYEQNKKYICKRYPVIKCNVVKTNGAGDTMTGTFLSFLSKHTYKVQQALKLGICATKFAVETPIGESTISSQITLDSVLKTRKDNPQL